MMRGHLPKGEILRERHHTAEHKLARARLWRRQMADRLAAAQEALDTAVRRELEAEQSATTAAAKVAAHEAGTAPTPRIKSGDRSAPPSPRRGRERVRMDPAERARRDALRAMLFDGFPVAGSESLAADDGSSSGSRPLPVPGSNRQGEAGQVEVNLPAPPIAGVHVAGREFRAVQPASSSRGRTEGAAQADILLPSADQLAGA